MSALEVDAMVEVMADSREMPAPKPVPIKPAPIISFPASGVPATKVTLRLCSASGLGPMVIVRRGKGQSTRVKILHRGSWT